MIKQISLKKDTSEVIAYMNDEELFRVSLENKTIDIEKLYNSLCITKDDSLENIILENNSNNKNGLDILYDNLKYFFDELIKKINKTILEFDFEKEEKILIEQ